MFRSSKVDSREVRELESFRPITAEPDISKLSPTPSISAELSYFAELERLDIRQQVDPAVTSSATDIASRFQVFDSVGQQCFLVREESELCMRACCPQLRGFRMHVFDTQDKEVIKMEREFVCCAGCCCCAGIGSCGFKLSVESPVGSVIGTIHEACYCLAPRFEIRNAAAEVIYAIKGPSSVCAGPVCPHDMPFLIMTADESQQVGCITRQYADFFQRVPKQRDKYRVDFGKTLDPIAKALVLSATFLIDMIFFDRDEYGGWG